LADAIEQQWQRSDNTKILQLCRHHLRSMGEFGKAPGQIDTLVLGCTHYPFALNELRSLVGETVQIIDNGEPVARHAKKVLADKGLTAVSGIGGIALFATGETGSLQHAADMWLGHAAQPVCQAQV